MNQSNIVLVSFTPLDAPGGVPKWNRDFISGLPMAKHYSWWDVPDRHLGESLPEWDKAKVLAAYLQKTKKVTKNDIVIADGFWADGYESNATISVCHGIWSHLIKEEADAGVPPDMPLYHLNQVNFRKRHLSKQRKLVAVSEFIQYQMQQQWGFESTVINNAIDLNKFNNLFKSAFPIPWKNLIIHGVNDKSNENKGWKHIKYLKDNLHNCEIMSLDEAYEKLNYDKKRTKMEILSIADLVVIPSGFEGNSYFSLECLACEVPILCYDVGLFWQYSPFNPKNKEINLPKHIMIMDRKKRNDLNLFKSKIEDWMKDSSEDSSLEIIKNHTIEIFHNQWKDYLWCNYNYITGTISV